MSFWKMAFYVLLVTGSLLVISAGLLAAKKAAWDLYIHDRYIPVFPSRLLLFAGILLLASLALWKGKLAH